MEGDVANLMLRAVKAYLSTTLIPSIGNLSDSIKAISMHSRLKIYIAKIVAWLAGYIQRIVAWFGSVNSDNQLSRRFENQIPALLSHYDWSKDISLILSVYGEDRSLGY